MAGYAFANPPYRLLRSARNDEVEAMAATKQPAEAEQVVRSCDEVWAEASEREADRHICPKRLRKELHAA